MKNILRLTGLVLTVFLLVLVSSLSADAVELNPSLKINVYCLHNQESTIKNVQVNYNQNVSCDNVAPIAKSSYDYVVREAVNNHQKDIEKYVEHLSKNGFDAKVLVNKLNSCLPKVIAVNEIEEVKETQETKQEVKTASTTKNAQNTSRTVANRGTVSNKASTTTTTQPVTKTETKQTSTVEIQKTTTVESKPAASSAPVETKPSYNFKIVITDSMLDRSCYGQSGYLNSNNLCLWAGKSVVGDNKASYYCAHNFTKYGRLITALSVGSYVSINGKAYKIVKVTQINKYGNYGSYAEDCYYNCFRSRGDKAYFQTCVNGDDSKMVIKEAIPVE